ncbi:MAG TPA: hypothetical protein VK151_08805 [Fluviicola sp.]|nr:hypothetical protein [Fluviicola sp.]
MTRKELLADLVLLQQSIEVLEKELSQYSWDSEIPLLIVTENDFINVLQRCLNDKIDFQTLSNWANAIECREDIEFETEEMQEVIFELANPEINDQLTKERLQEFINELVLNK